MRLSPQLTIICSSVLALCFSSCGGPNGVRITEGHQETTASAHLSSKKTRAHIVHIDLFERIATIRHGMPLGGEFLITTNYAGVETAVLKVRPNPGHTLVTGDILEGDPKINNMVKLADPARSAELAKIYSIANTDD